MEIAAILLNNIIQIHL